MGQVTFMSGFSGQNKNCHGEMNCKLSEVEYGENMMVVICSQGMPAGYIDQEMG